MRIRNILLTALLLAVAIPARADVETYETSYRRSSICSFLISRTDQDMYERIQQKYLEIPTPDQYNNHDLSIRIINVGKKGQYADSIADWLVRNKVASRIVGKWFDRNPFTGECSLDLVKNRGLYNATELDRELASRSARGMAMLEDAGEDLIGNTFVLVHEAHYIDNAERSRNVGTGLKVAGIIGSAFLGSGFSDLMDNFGDLAATFKGFRVKFHTRLYQLEWDDATSGTFYKECYAENNDPAKMAFFDNNRNMFRLKYIGEVESSGSKNSFLGISEEHPDIMIRKACQRAIDDNVRDLQKKFEVFRVKSPIKSVENGEVAVAIGLKEGVNPESEYEVLEIQEDKGKIKYRRTGVIQPVEGKIWDNRYMAKEEGAYGSDLNVTTFKVKSGSIPYEGQLVRQIK